MATLTWTVELALSGWGSGWTDVSADVRIVDPIIAEYGIRGGSGPTDVVAEPGVLTFTLDNSAANSAGLFGYYAPWHDNNRTGFAVNCPVRLRITYDGTTQNAFVGHITDIDVEPGLNRSWRTRVTCTDAMGTFAETYVSGVSVQLNKRADQLITTLIPAAAEYDLQLETGAYTFATAFHDLEDNRTTLREGLHKIAMSERGRIYVFSDDSAADPKLFFLNRNRQSTYTSVFYHFTDADLVDIQIARSRDDLAQTVQVTAYPTITDTSAVVLWNLEDAEVFISAGATVDYLFGPFRDPANPGERIGGTNFEAVTATTDYLFNSAADGTGTNLTANLTATASTTASGVRWTLTNVGSTAGFVTHLQLRGRGIYRRPVVIEREVPDTYGTRTESFAMPYQNDIFVATDVAAERIAFHSSPSRPGGLMWMTYVANKSDTLAFWAVRLQPSYRIAVSESMTGLDTREFVISGVRIELHGSGEARYTYFLEAVRTSDWISVAYAAGNFTTSGAATWTVSQADQITYAYTTINDGESEWTTTIAFTIKDTSVSAAVGALRIALDNVPIGPGFPAGETRAVFNYRDNGTFGSGFILASDSATYLELYKVDQSNWAISTNNTDVFGQITFHAAIT